MCLGEERRELMCEETFCRKFRLSEVSSEIFGLHNMHILRVWVLVWSLDDRVSHVTSRWIVLCSGMD